METDTTLTTERLLERRRDDRVVAGVAAAIARHLEIEVGLVRVLFVLTALFGGFGLIAYLAGVLLIPSEKEAKTPLARWFDRFAETEDTSKKLGWILMTLAAVIVVTSTGLFSSPFVLAAVLLVAGLALINRNTDTKDGNA